MTLQTATGSTLRRRHCHRRAPAVRELLGKTSRRAIQSENPASAARQTYREGGSAAMIRYGFTIRTRMGQRIDNVSIIAGSQLDAERRLRQMYIQCEILECRERSIPRRFEAANVHMLDLMAINPPTIQHHG
jgi:hypothetical protein